MTSADATLGQQLRAAREQAGLTAAEVSAATRIRPHLLADLEADRLDSCGGAVYGRGHVRALARVLELDPAPLVALHDRQTGAEPPSLRRLVPAPRARSRRGPQARGWAQAGIGTLAVLLLLLAIGTAAGRSDVAEADAAGPPAAGAPTGAALLGLRLAGGETRVRVSAGEQVLFDGVVGNGWARTFERAGELRLDAADAAVVRVSCGGGMGAPAGEPGARAVVVCGPGGLTRP